MTDAKNFDSREFRTMLGRFYTGVTVVTTIDKHGEIWGVTANSFSSVSLDPPLVLWSQALTSDSHSAFLNAERFAINILTADQIDESKRFARSGAGKFDGAKYRIGLGDVPVLMNCCAVFECLKVAVHDGGDHKIFVGQVEGISCDSDAEPLLFGGGQYLRSAPLN